AKAYREYSSCQHDCSRDCHDHWHVKYQEPWEVDYHQPEQRYRQHERVERVEPQDKVMESPSKERLPHLRPHDGYRVGKRSRNRDCKLGAFAKYDVVAGERLEDCHHAKYDASHPEYLVSDLVAPAKVLVVHVQERHHDHS